MLLEGFLMFKRVLADRLLDLKRGFTTFPKPSDILFSAIIVLIYAITVGIIGSLTGFFKIGILRTNIWVMVLLPVSLFFWPSLLEETFFRGVLLPHKGRKLSRRYLLLYSFFNILAFIVWHPLNALTINRLAYPIFTNPIFLCLATFMAIACTVTYLKSGSIWIPIVIHWLTVLIWVFFLSGRNILLDVT
jgi:predicted Abi (CAAX) family protease